jgi:adenosylcobinamide amidohydrolase
VIIQPERHARAEDGLDLPYLVWRLPTPCRVVSSAVLGGGIGERAWILNAQVRHGYDRLDPAEHLRELAEATGLRGEGVGLLTAADVDAVQSTTDGGSRVDATVGIRVPTWAAAPDGAAAIVPAAGTINVVGFVPVPLTDGALVNLATTATEAKTQALLDAGVPGTGTATDAVCIVSPPGDAVELFGGPRSVWGARLARAVHAAVLGGTELSRPRIDPDAGTRR